MTSALRAPRSTRKSRRSRPGCAKFSTSKATRCSMASVLLVDDEPAVLRAFKRALERADHQVATALDGQSALELVRSGGRFDVIVSDLNMPRLSGTEFLRAIREHDLDVPVVLASGEPTLQSALEAVEHGAFRYL